VEGEEIAQRKKKSTRKMTRTVEECNSGIRIISSGKLCCGESGIADHLTTLLN